VRSALPSRALRADINRLAEMRVSMVTADQTAIQAAAEVAIDVHGRGLGGRHRERVSRRTLYALSTAALRNADSRPAVETMSAENHYEQAEPAAYADALGVVDGPELMPQPVMAEAA
jgi:hypothetical protein